MNSCDGLQSGEPLRRYSILPKIVLVASLLVIPVMLIEWFVRIQLEWSSHYSDLSLFQQDLFVAVGMISLWGSLINFLAELCVIGILIKRRRKRHGLRFVFLALFITVTSFCVWGYFVLMDALEGIA